jgi:hypothetical protein
MSQCRKKAAQLFQWYQGKQLAKKTNIWLNTVAAC